MKDYGESVVQLFHNLMLHRPHYGHTGYTRTEYDRMRLRNDACLVLLFMLVTILQCLLWHVICYVRLADGTSNGSQNIIYINKYFNLSHPLSWNLQLDVVRLA